MAGILGIFCFFPYLRDVFKKKTMPHAYSWLIWGILQTVSTIAIITSHGGYYGTLGIATGAILCLFVFFLSFKYGTKNITRSDTFCLVAALVAILIWIFTKNPFYSVILVSLIDFTDFIPTLRKGYQEPWSETTSLYVMAAVSDIFALLALSTYSIPTALYLSTLVFSNSLFVIILLSRRPQVQKI